MIYDESNENIENGYIAPGKSGYFDIVLDPSGTDVAISYEINVRLDECAYPNNIKLSVENTSTDGGVEVIGNTFKGLISLNDIKNNKTITLKLTLIWENNEEFNIGRKFKNNVIQKYKEHFLRWQYIIIL